VARNSVSRDSDDSAAACGDVFFCYRFSSHSHSICLIYHLWRSVILRVVVL
jgi:hypothetical protein